MTALSATLPMFAAPQAAKPLPAEVLRAAEIDGVLRLRLVRAWRSGPTCLFVGLNPSSADHERDDMTALKWLRLANGWGLGGYCAVNLYPFRTSSPAACRRWAAAAPRHLLDRNLEVVAREERLARLVVACWGAAGPWAAAETARLVERLLIEGVDLWCLGVNADGSPIHALARGRHRVADDAKPVMWRRA